MVATGAQQLHAGGQGQTGGIHILQAQGQQHSPAFAPIAPPSHRPESPLPGPAPGQGGLGPGFDHFPNQLKRIGEQPLDRSPPQGLAAQQDRLPQAQVVDPVDPPALQQPGQVGGVAA